MASTARMLIVEDDLDLIDMLSAYFRVQGYEIMTAAWGEDALAIARTNTPDLILMDIRLPDIDGYEVCRRLRQQRLTRHVPIIFLTERRQRDDRLNGLELGAVDYITKPFDIQELRLRTRNALRRSRLNALVNPVTGLPEGTLVKERLEQMLSQPNWALIVTSVSGLARFRDTYGFVAADDVARAVSLMITNALIESGSADTFVGHLDAAAFIIITGVDQRDRLVENCLHRLQPAIPYFYPAAEREQLPTYPEAERLNVHVHSITADDGEIADLTALHAVLGQQLS